MWPVLIHLYGDNFSSKLISSKSTLKEEISKSFSMMESCIFKAAKLSLHIGGQLADDTHIIQIVNRPNREDAFRNSHQTDLFVNDLN